jgi:hypothetical protein
MPYYIYKIIPGETATARTLEFSSEHDGFQEAKNEVRALRTTQPADSNVVYKIIFAESRPEAEQRLREHREKPIPKEWEV